jgi:hypothetical protein
VLHKAQIWALDQSGPEVNHDGYPMPGPSDRRSHRVRAVIVLGRGLRS